MDTDTENTLTGLLEDAARSPFSPQLRLPRSGRTLSLHEVLVQAQHTAGDLYDQGVRRGDRVGMVLQNGPGFVRTLLGVMYAGAVPVPLALPVSFGGLDAYGAHLRRVTLDAGMRHLVIGPELARLASRLSAAVADAGATVVPLESLPGDRSRLSVPSDPDDLAFIQYTSGSTSAPKGVALTHRNIVAGLAAIRCASRLGGTDVLGVWLPLFHDMGLFSLLSGLVSCGTVVLWQPADFVRDPAVWLREFAAFGCGVCSMPNFAYDYLLGVADQFTGTGLDLSAWRLACNGAETVQPHTVLRFAERFAEFGFRESAICPVYGMAEATLAVSFSRVGQPPHITWVDREELAARGRAVAAVPGGAGSRALVSVGRAVPGVEIRVRADDALVPDGTVGEIEITGPPVTRGYHRGAGADRFTPDGWLRTGDLGFLQRGELCIVGRSKDVIIVRGSNYYAEDAEALARDLPDVYRNRCVAVPVELDGEERLAVVAETKLEDPARRTELVRAVQNALRSALGLPGAVVRLVPPHRLPRTSSGKVRRSVVRQAVEGGEM